MSTIDQQPPATGSPIIPRQRTDDKGGVLAGWFSSTDHKVIGYMYLITSFGFFLIAGLMAIIIRLQLFQPNNKIVSDQLYNELFTMHGTLMLLLFGTPLFIGFANVVMPLQIGASDVAFPRMNLAQLLLLPVRRADPAGQFPRSRRRGRRRPGDLPQPAGPVRLRLHDRGDLPAVPDGVQEAPRRG